MTIRVNGRPPLIMAIFSSGKRKRGIDHTVNLNTTLLVNRDWKTGKADPSMIVFRFNDDFSGYEKAVTSLIKNTYREYPFTWSMQHGHSIRIAYQHLPPVMVKVFSVDGKTLVMSDILLNGNAHASTTTLYHY